MNKMKTLFQIFLIILFISGVFVFAKYKRSVGLETMEVTQSPETNSKSSCPSLLVKKGNILMLYNNDKPIVEGDNPIPFYNLDEYINYLEIQRRKGIHCPVLFLQQEQDAQGENVYRVRPSPFDLQGGLPSTAEPIMYKDNAQGMPVPIKSIDASRQNPPYNEGNYAGFDPTGLYVGKYTDLDKIHDSTNEAGRSDNPMDANWGGIMHTQQMIDSGKYDDYNIKKPILITPKMAFNPNLPSSFPPPKDIIE